MFTIGGLLNNYLAHPLLSDTTIICWEALIIMVLESYLVLVIIHSFERSAGNLRLQAYNRNIQVGGRGGQTWGSSETRHSHHNKL